MPPQAQIFALKHTYLYYTRYYAMLNKMDQVRRENVLANINKNIEDPLAFKSKFVSGSKKFWNCEYFIGRCWHCRNGLSFEVHQMND